MLTINELFSGIGAFRKALLNCNIPHKIIGISEIDKYAIKSYNAMYGLTYNYGNISLCSSLMYSDLWTYGFPCQDISLAGLQKGIIENETRSGLLFDVKRLLLQAAKEKTLPKFLLMENVKNIVSKRFIQDFSKWVHFLSDLHYNNYIMKLNAKDYGIPQNRERIFLLSIRYDIDNKKFIPPKKQPLCSPLCNFMDADVDISYYLTDDKAKPFISIDKDLDSNYLWMNPLPLEQYKPNCIGGIGYKKSNNCTQYYLQNRIYDCIIATTITANYKFHPYYVLSPFDYLEYRKLTPLECWRLMGFSDNDFKVAQSVCSDTQLYKQSGNSIVVNCLEAIFNTMKECDLL